MNPSVSAEPEKRLSTLSPAQRFVTGILIAALVCGFSYLNWFRSLDWIVYDAAQRIADRAPPTDVVIIAIDEASIRQLGRWPWSRSVHADLIDRLRAAQARAVVLDIIFADPQAVPANADLLLQTAMERARNVLLPVHIAQTRHGGALAEVLPLANLSRAAAGLGHVHFEADADGVCRSVFLREGLGQPYWPHLSVTLESFLDQIPVPESASLSTDVTGAAEIVRDERRLIPFLGVNRTFPRLSYADIMQGKVAPAALKDKIVFVGATAAGLGDRVVTPTSSSERILSGVELNATIFHALRSQSFLQQFSPAVQFGLNFLIALSLVLCSAFLAPRQLLIFTLSSFTGINLIALVLPGLTGFWIGPAAASAACVLSYLFWSLRRMQQALQFLRSELQALASERTFLHRPQHLDDLYAGLRFISGILPVQGWTVFLNDQRLVSWGECVVKQPLTREDALWLHEAGQSVFALDREDERLRVSIVWQNRKAASPEFQPLFDSLVSNLLQPQRTPMPRAPEALTHTIQNLQLASRAFKDVSRLAQRSLSRLADGVAITDRSGRLLFENMQFSSLVHDGNATSRKNVLDRLTRLSTTLGEEWHELLCPVYVENETVQCEVETPEGIHLLCQAHPLRTETQEQYVILVLTDISVLKEYERARTETLNFLSHDLRSPLVSILALIENARSNPGMPSDPQLLKEIESYARTNLRFAENFLQLARAEASDAIGFDPIDLHAVIENVVAEALPLAATADVILRASYCDQDAWVMGSADLLQRAIANLVSNAIKFSEADDTVTIELAVDGNHGICRVTDQGMGIPETDIASIFERFNRGSGHASKARSGTGLGLRLVKVVSDRHGGEVSVSSEPGKGSVFTLRLPLVAID